MKIKFTLLAFLSILLLNPMAKAINEPEDDAKSNYGIISGRIIDEESLPLPGATVIVDELQQGVISDENGYYRIVKLDEGQYTVTVSYIGFKDETKAVQVKIGETTTIDFQLEAGIDLSEVVINGALQGQSKALTQQKNNINISNIISSDQVGRFPDANIGDALKRVPGINVQYDQGEARFGHIRGTAPEYNSVTIDGDRIPSAEAEIRSVQLDLVPSDMVQSMEVNKVVTSDMDADAIGGSINLVTKSNPYKQRITGTIGTTYNALTEKPAENIALLYADRFMNEKLGMTLSASRQNHLLGSENVEAEWDDEETLKEFQIRQYYVQRLRQSYSAAFDYTFNANNRIDFKAMFNHRNDWENRYRVVYKDLEEDPGKAVIERQLKAGTNKNARLEDQRTLHLSLGGDHQFGILTMDWKASYSKANEDRPNERYLQYVREDVLIDQNVADPSNVSLTIHDIYSSDFNPNWELDELTEEFQYTEDIDKTVKVDFELPLSNNSTSMLKFGAKYKAKSKNRDNDYYEYDPLNKDSFNADVFSSTKNQTKSNFLAGDYVVGTFAKREFLADLDLENSSKFKGEKVLEELAGNYDATENVFASYARFDKDFGAIELVAGVRMENTSLKYSGFQYDADEDVLTPTDEEESSYTNILPSLMVKYNMGENTQIKAAWTNTISRPKYFALVPYVEVSAEDNEISIGNPELDPTTSMNLDLMFEHYFGGSVGVITGGVFYKKIEDFIVEEVKDDYSFQNNTWDEFVQPINGGDATLYGFEASFQRQFDFLPGFLRQMGFYTNYTYTYSEVSDFQVEDREDEKVTLPGSPEHNLNASLFYEGAKFSCRVSFNYASDFVDEFGGEAFEDRYYDKVSYLDINTSYKINKNFQIYAEATNLLNTPLRYYQGESEYTMQEEYYDVKVNLGLKFDF